MLSFFVLLPLIWHLTLVPPLPYPSPSPAVSKILFNQKSYVSGYLCARPLSIHISRQQG